MSDKFKFAFRVAISLTIAYLLPMALGWSQPSTAATTVMLIASTGSRRESFAKGTLRVLGTIAGGIIGLMLVGAFAQDRFQYMLAVSVVITVIFYIRSAYLKDPTLFMLTGVMILMMYNGGDAEGAFIYGLDRTFMTIFGVVIYTLVGVFLFPPKVERNLQKLATALTEKQRELFNRISGSPKTEDQTHHEAESPNTPEKETEEGDVPAPTIAELSQQLFQAQQAFETRYHTINADCSEISAYKKEWDGSVALYQKITEILLFAAKEHSRSGGHPSEFIHDFEALREQLIAMFDRIPTAWQAQHTEAPEYFDPIECDKDKLEQAGHLYRGEAISSAYLLKQLRERLAQLHTCISSIDSVVGRVPFELPSLKALPDFNWWDAENAKTAVKVFLTYWCAALFWIYFNPPGGYNFIVLSTLFVSILSYLPVHPFLLFILFTLGFIFSVPAYVFILPQLTLGSELAAFIFIYTFVGFYIFKGPVTIFFLLGMFTLGINNEMVYHFGITIMIVSLFYLVVISVIFSYYFPFSARSEHLVLVFRERFFRHAKGIILLQQNSKRSTFQQLELGWRIATMKVALKKMTVWSTKINAEYYAPVTLEALTTFNTRCDVFHHHLMTLLQAEKSIVENPLVSMTRGKYKDRIIPALAQSLVSYQDSAILSKPLPSKAMASEAISIDCTETDSQFIVMRKEYTDLERQLDQYFSTIEIEKYSNSDIAGFYIFLNLKKNIFESLIACKQAHDDISWVTLSDKKF
ncbi:FUSC family protein [Photobacterium minamisatsumaniensis]|uniref:FUSC family protein n=1 Tax=Photobacterium minamisatsumaniensis TaxID=2910233 RepID=UPI003D0C92AE